MFSVVASLLAAHAFVPKLAWLAVGRKQPLVADVLGELAWLAVGRKQPLVADVLGKLA